MLYYTHIFLSYGMGGGCTKNREQLFDIKARGKIVPVVKLRRAEVVVSSRQYPRKKPVTCIRPGIASFGGSFPLEVSLENCRRC